VPLMLTLPLNTPAVPLELRPHTPIAPLPFSASPTTPAPPAPSAKPLMAVLKFAASVACADSATAPTAEATKLPLPRTSSLAVGVGSPMPILALLRAVNTGTEGKAVFEVLTNSDTSPTLKVSVPQAQFL